MEKLKQKVASSSSRVIASLHQAATGNFQQQQQQQQQIPPAPSGAEEPAISSQMQVQQQQQQQQQPDSSPLLQQQKDNQSKANVPASVARMMAADATAHLTEQEREILLEVFRKEEQFQRDTIKQMVASRSAQVAPSQQQQQQQNLRDPNYNNNNNQLESFNNKENSQQQQQPTPVANHHGHRSGSSNSTSTPQFAAAGSGGLRSATPISSMSSRASSSSQLQHQSHQRASSSCSATSGHNNSSSSSALLDSMATPTLGQCRICRKSILANETCHLCSACNQFVCEDCGSYSASNQHWVCSSCRRRATKPAITADALKELGLNQNSSAFRRMTLRLNQAELKLAFDQSQQAQVQAVAGSSNLPTSGGCSSAALQAVAATNGTDGGNDGTSQNGSSSRLTAQQPGGATAASGSVKRPQAASSSAGLSASDGGSCRKQAENATMRPNTRVVVPPAASPTKVYQQQQQQPRLSVTGPTNLKQKCDDVTGTANSSHNRLTGLNSDETMMKNEARKSLSQPISRQQAQQTGETHYQQSSQGSKSTTDTVEANNNNNNNYLPGRQESLQLDQQLQLQQLARRASVNIGVEQQQQMRRCSGTGSGLPAAAATQRKHSTATYYPAQTINPTHHHHHQFQETQTYYNVGGVVQPSAIAGQHQHYQVNTSTTNKQQITTMMTTNNNNNNTAGYDKMARRGSNAASGQQQQQQYSAFDSAGQKKLTPMSADQLHHQRRLSDQSNLVRRSSIISEAMDAISMTRNRSQSNIGTGNCVDYFYQSQPLRLLQQQQQAPNQFDPTISHNQANYTCTTPNAFGQQQQNVGGYSAGSQHYQPPTDPWIYSHQLPAQQQRQMYPSQQQLSSIVTPYAQKSSRRQSSEDMRSDSSSDIEDDLRVIQTAGLEFNDNPNEQPNEHFAPPRPLSETINDYMMMSPSNHSQMMMAGDSYSSQQHQHQQNTNQTAPISIPSVSVSEFGPGQLQQQQQQQRIQQQQTEIMTTPMQINSAIEQVIRKQEQQQYRATNELLIDGDSLLPFIRRGSSGRILPKIPGEQQQQQGQQQSRSLLDLPYSQQNGANKGDQQGVSTLDLPGSGSGTIRRASAPEGQNIKIVVDDIDGTMMRSGTGGIVGKQHHRMVYGSKGEFYERLVLYRDDSIDPQTNMVRGFGLQVMGGKIDDDGRLQAYVSWILPGGPADKVGLRPTDRIIEWDGKCLVDKSYEQVSDVIESTGNIAELLVRPTRGLDDYTYNTGANYVRSQRRLSQQTERDLKRNQQQQAGSKGAGPFPQTNGLMMRQMNETSRLNADGTYRLAGTQLQQQNFQCPSKTRSGTGRKLPQIPNLIQGAANNGSGFASSKLNAIDNNLTGGQQQQQQLQSLSTGELYHNRGSTASWEALQGILPVSNQSNNNNPSLFGNGNFSNYHPGVGRIGHSSQSSLMVNDRPGQMSSVTNNNADLSVHDKMCGLIGLQVSVDDHVGQLEISILSAINIDRDPSLDYHVRVKILPESNRFKPCNTQPSCDMNWKETFIFQNFPTQQIHRMALEIGIWVHEEAPRLSTKIAQPICETLISIQSARERNTDFWPLWPPPTSPQARRKSLNDLIETHTRQVEGGGGTFLINRKQQYDSQQLQQHQQSNHRSNSNQFEPQQNSIVPIVAYGRLQTKAYDSIHRYPGIRGDSFNRERSSSARNLPSADSNKSRSSQPRRASDEVAGSSTHRLSARVSPAASRRSISVMNVGDGGSGGPITLLTRPSFRLGSQGSIMKPRRDSSQQQQQQYSTGGSPKGGRYTSPSGSVSRVNESPKQQQQVGVTPSGRRSSLVGIQSMRGYASQKNSHSGSTTDQESPMRTNRRAQSASNAAAAIAAAAAAAVTATASTSGPLTQTGSDGKPTKQVLRQVQQQQQHRGSATAASSHSGSSAASANCSRRGSNSEQSNQLQRKGSFAMQTLRKLKRTMSFSKNTGESVADMVDGYCKNESRRSSSSSELGENVGISRRLTTHPGSAGKLKLSFVMTKGQLEVDVICAQGLRFDQESILGIYVKIYLKAKSKSNKRKTRTVVPSEAPVFRQLIKYDGSLVDNKALEVSVWHKQGGLRGKAPIGFTEIQLSELKLEQLQTSWYNLYPMDMVCSSSIDE